MYIFDGSNDACTEDFLTGWSSHKNHKPKGLLSPVLSHPHVLFHQQDEMQILVLPSSNIQLKRCPCKLIYPNIKYKILLACSKPKLSCRHLSTIWEKCNDLLIFIAMHRNNGEPWLFEFCVTIYLGGHGSVFWVSSANFFFQKSGGAVLKMGSNQSLIYIFYENCKKLPILMVKTV